MAKVRNVRRLGLRLGFLVMVAALTLGTTTDTGTRFTDLGHKLMCTCGCGQVLLECNHVGCQASEQMRRELTAAIQRGGNDDQILNWFVEKYGPVVLSAPAKTGFGRVAWVMPYVALLGGLMLTALIVRMWRSRSQATPAASASHINPVALEAIRRRVHEETEL
jgi:cytochrome c-type biogenesis protein CcmH